MKQHYLSTFATALFMAGTLAGCSQAGTQGSTEAKPAVFACKPSDFASFIGQNESILAATSFQQGMAMRIIKPGQPVTEDFSPSRVNFVLDAKGTITEVTCG